MRLTVVGAALIGVFFSTPSPAPVRVGEGGDDVRMTVTTARMITAHRLEKILSCSFRGDADEAAKAWILTHQEALVRDVINSSHEWTDGPQPDAPNTCARTNGPDEPSDQGTANAISFSIDACHHTITTYAAAERLLTHESVHHFGIKDEAFADQVATAVLGADIVDQCSSRPLQLAVGVNLICLLDGDAVRCTGDTTKDATYTGIPVLRHVRKLRAARQAPVVCAIDDDGLKCWGKRASLNDRRPAFLPLENPGPDFTLADGYGCAIADNKVSCWGQGTDAFALEGDRRLDNPRLLAGGYRFACALQEGGVLCPSSLSLSFSPQPLSTTSFDTAYNLLADSSELCVIAQGKVECFGSVATDDPFHLRERPINIGNVHLADVYSGRICVAGAGQVACRGTYGEKRFVVPGISAIALGDSGALCVADNSAKVSCSDASGALQTVAF